MPQKGHHNFSTAPRPLRRRTQGRPISLLALHILTLFSFLFPSFHPPFHSLYILPRVFMNFEFRYREEEREAGRIRFRSSRISVPADQGFRPQSGAGFKVGAPPDLQVACKILQPKCVFLRVPASAPTRICPTAVSSSASLGEVFKAHYFLPPGSRGPLY